MSDSEQERDDFERSDEEEDFDDRDHEEDEEEEDEDEEEDVRAKSSKKKRASSSKSTSRKRAKNFFLDEAEVADDDDEDDYDDDDGGGDNEYSSEAREAARMARELEMRAERHHRAPGYIERSAAEIVEDVQTRYRRQHRPMFADGGGEYDMAPEVTQQSLLPKSTDPSLWVVRCKPGSEQMVVLSLMRKALHYKESGRDLGINAAFSTASKGYIYIEASHEASARETIHGLNLIQQYTLKKLPLDQMTAVLTIRQTRKPLVIGQWARYKRGPYKGDLCKVLDVIEGGDRVVVQVVPRLDYSKLKIPGARALATTLKEKYPQKFFNATECAQSGGAVDRVRYPGLMQEACDYFEGNYFRQGFLLKEIKPDTMLNWENVQPTIAELQQFRDRKEQEDDDYADDAASVQPPANLLDELAQMGAQSTTAISKAVKFQAGDMVQVISGDLINLIGKIQSIDEVTGAVTLEPRSAAFEGTVQVSADQLIKHIEVGSHIKVLGGAYAGHTGTVVAIEELEGDYVCVVLTDGLKTELKVNVSDVVETSEVTTGLSNLAGYELYDLVALGQSDTAVVVGVGAEHLRVITHQSIEKQVRPQELRGKRNLQSLRATAMDNVQNTLQEGDIVTVVKGSFAKKTGTIKHIHKGTLWLHSNSHHKNAGIFVVRSRSCMLSGARARAAITNMRSGTAMPRGGGGMGARQSNEYKDMTVQITKGPYKGLLGRVIDANDTHLRVELNAKLKKVMIEIDKVIKVGDKDGALGGSQMGSRGPAAYPMGIPDTPAIIAETPRHIPDTPLYIAETPTHDAMPYTPSRPTTPGHDSIWRPTARPIMPTPSGASDDYGGFRPSSDQAFMPIPSTYGSTGTGYQSGYTARAYSHSPYGDASSIYTPSYGEGFSPNPTPLSHAPSDIAPSEWPPNIVLVFKSGPEVGSEVTLIENLGDNMRVQMPDGRYDRVPARELGPANPQRKDTVVVLSGSYKGLTGVLKRYSDDTGVDESDVYVKPLDGSPAVVVPKLCLGKLAA